MYLLNHPIQLVIGAIGILIVIAPPAASVFLKFLNYRHRNREPKKEHIPYPHPSYPILYELRNGQEAILLATKGQRTPEYEKFCRLRNTLGMIEFPAPKQQKAELRRRFPVNPKRPGVELRERRFPSPTPSDN
jgi:hypothetical protein